jgi:sulfite exporter TauE/SafE
MVLLGSIPFSISTPCLLVFKKVKKVLISGIPSKAKILGLVFGRGTFGTGLMMIAFPMIYHAVRNAEEGITNPKKVKWLVEPYLNAPITPSLVFDRDR